MTFHKQRRRDTTERDAETRPVVPLCHCARSPNANGNERTEPRPPQRAQMAFNGVYPPMGYNHTIHAFKRVTRNGGRIGDAVTCNVPPQFGAFPIGSPTVPPTEPERNNNTNANNTNERNDTNDAVGMLTNDTNANDANERARVVHVHNTTRVDACTLCTLYHNPTQQCTPLWYERALSRDIALSSNALHVHATRQHVHATLHASPVHATLRACRRDASSDARWDDASRRYTRRSDDPWNAITTIAPRNRVIVHETLSQREVRYEQKIIGRRDQCVKDRKP